ncbi:hypothetical protein M3210_16750 [Oceanobacillus luteolus]|uniref:DNA modification system-associated small protein n=1 Tax=Oceanobacillus luteolus TaxID=1274358 RepID=UPI002040A05F|nr:DNA modification system-associated small protein [Oceanobacillus luteolus]MCM3741904.1 hypothetical protein [Oceanobacillus luteolus]
MNKIERREIEILVRVSKQHDLPLKLMKTLLQTAKKFTYENQTSTARRKEYQDLISFHDKNRD